MNNRIKKEKKNWGKKNNNEITIKKNKVKTPKNTRTKNNINTFIARNITKYWFYKLCYESKNKLIKINKYKSWREFLKLQLPVYCKFLRQIALNQTWRLLIKKYKRCCERKQKYLLRLRLRRRRRGKKKRFVILHLTLTLNNVIAVAVRGDGTALFTRSLGYDGFSNASKRFFTSSWSFGYRVGRLLRRVDRIRFKRFVFILHGRSRDRRLRGFFKGLRQCRFFRRFRRFQIITTHSYNGCRMEHFSRTGRQYKFCS
jgi:hypothetical protein